MSDVLGVLLAVFFLAALAWALNGAWRAGARRLRGRRARGARARLAEALRAEEAGLRAQLGESPTREQLEASAAFAAAVERLRARNVPADVLTVLARDANRWVSRLALGALVGRDDLPHDWPSIAVRRLRHATADQQWLVLRTLERVPDPVVGPVLSQLDEVRGRDAAELIAVRMSDGRETVDGETLRKHVPLRFARDVEALCAAFDDILPFELWFAVEEWRTGAASEAAAAAVEDASFLAPYGKVWERPFDDPPALLTRDRQLAVELILEALTSDPPESVLLVGEHGVGKTSVVRAALDRLEGDWLVFEATAASVNAGAMFVGELEGRVEELASQLKGRKAVWVLPGLEDALYAGRHSMSPQGLLDHLLPHVDAGEIRIVTEAAPAAWEALVAQRPRLATVFRSLRLRPLGERDAIGVARHALEHAARGVSTSDRVLTEAFELAQQFLPVAAPPGNVVPLVVTSALAAADEGRTSLASSDLLHTLAAASGLPLALLDAAAPLDLRSATAFFEERVLGQPEAVETLVERIALVKAGLTDPSRPLGVFLFVGPTGTGKTEIAKALAEYLFGSASRLVRLDMSEFQTPESLERLLADTALEPQGAPLIAAVRKDPFSVVLLDEFEKAAAPIWDVFLQVFDDGRLTDSHGRVVDFRRCVIVLTSNIGSSILGGLRPGFERAPEPFRPEAVERAVTRSFRPEFVNRIDRIVVFRPFERAHMRELLEKELAEVALRRGFRGRPWAVEYDESALAFLIDEGFSPELGARPLKRAVERHLLTPLARAIATHEVPAGDQFLFVTAAPGGLDVRFVDPDAEPAEPSTEAEEQRPGGPELDVRALVLKPRGDAGAVSVLADELERVRAAVADASLRSRKEAALAAVAEPGFWERESRFVTLAEAEYLDRLEAALRTAEKLGRRLQGRAGRNGKGSADLVALLASRLHVLDHALADAAEGPPYDVLVRVHPVAEAAVEEGAAFARVLADMYLGWAERRGMRATRHGAGGADVVLAVSGLGARRILADETGLHVLELPDEEHPGERPAERVGVAVQIAPWPPGLALDEPDARQRVAAGLAAAPAPTRVVRRYRRDPTPLVRDAVRGFRTGRLDRVLAGDFDVL